MTAALLINWNKDYEQFIVSSDSFPCFQYEAECAKLPKCVEIKEKLEKCEIRNKGREGKTCLFHHTEFWTCVDHCVCLPDFDNVILPCRFPRYSKFLIFLAKIAHFRHHLRSSITWSKLCPAFSWVTSPAITALVLVHLLVWLGHGWLVYIADTCW